MGREEHNHATYCAYDADGRLLGICAAAWPDAARDFLEEHRDLRIELHSAEYAKRWFGEIPEGDS